MESERGIVILCGLCLLIAPAHAATSTVMVNFGNFPNGWNPYGTLIRDAAGNLYGTTYAGGAANLGVVFKLDATGKYAVLYNFQGADGASPYAGVAMDSAGDLYGTTYAGGAANLGVVFKLTPDGQETVLHSFTGGNDGANPYAGVAVDSSGNLYGTTYQGGTSNAGVVYQISASDQASVLYSFTGGKDGGNPVGGVIADSSGNLYGTTLHGGAVAASRGTIYELDGSGHLTVLHQFTRQEQGNPRSGVIRDAAGYLYGTTDSIAGSVYKLDLAGALTILHQFNQSHGPGAPAAGLAMDAAGNLYGTTLGGRKGQGTVYMVSASGTFSVMYHFPADSAPGANYMTPGVVLDSSGNIYGATPYGGKREGGMIYRLAPSGQETTLYKFAGAHLGTAPDGVLLRDADGSFYGTTDLGGPANVGVIYKLDAKGHQILLHSFRGRDGAHPTGGLVQDSTGNLYGTAVKGGAHDAGVVYKLDAGGNFSVLHSFSGGTDGAWPDAGVILDSSGNLYGTTFAGGPVNAGVVFKVSPNGNEKVMYGFMDGADGGVPTTGLVRDPAGNLYGNTVYGGSGSGVVFKISPSGQESVLYTFTGGSDGDTPGSALIRDAQGNLYGTAQAGRGNEGTVYRIDSAGNFTVLYTFPAGGFGVQGVDPIGGIVRDSAGNLYGTTDVGGDPNCDGSAGCGVVYKVDPSGHQTLLHTFTGADGDSPAGVIRDNAGNLYGVCSNGGATGGGVLYKIGSD